MSLTIKLILLALISTSISACHFKQTESNWPDNIPKRSIFVEAYNEQVLAGNNNSSLNGHLTWIKRFYQGLSIYPGWNDMTKIVIESLSDLPIAEQKNTSKRLSQLGQKIAIEWAQSNDKRNIDSANINVWGNALRTSVKEKQQLNFISRVEKDVDDLIARKLNMRTITYDRYYKSEELDDF